MTDVDARSHGGDGAGDDPPGGSYRPQSGCESSHTSKKRGSCRNLKLFQKVDALKSRLPIQFDFSKNQYTAIGENRSSWIGGIGSHVGAGGYHHATWDDVPERVRKDLFNFLESQFDLESYKNTPEWPWIVEGIAADCRNRYNDRRNKEKKIFFDLGGYENVEEVKQNPPKGHDPENWRQLVDHFCSEEHKKRSAANTINRSKMKYPSLHGSRSYAQGRHLAGDGSKCIDLWKEKHTRNGEWVNEKAEADWEKIQQELQRMEAAAEEGGPPVNETECIEIALGARRGFTRGVGRQVRRPSSFSHLTATGSSSSANDERVARVEEQLRKLQEEVAAMKKSKGSQAEDEAQYEDDYDNM